MRAAWLVIGLALSACAGAETLYRLPWADGRSFMFTQAPGGEAVAAHHDAAANEGPLTYEGNFVRVRHPDGTAAIYAHLKHRGVAVAVGESVETGQLLGYSGASGDVEEPHLHFAVIRTERNSAGWQEDVSVPVKFYVGVPPVAFSPRAALRVTANYSGIAELPRAPSETPLFPFKRPTLEPGEEPRAWALLALWLACGVAGLAWFWKFAKD